MLFFLKGLHYKNKVTIIHFLIRYQKQIEETKAILPYDQMTMEDFKDAHPDIAIDPINKPTFWPHNEEEQLDYVDPDKQAHSSH